MSQPQDVTLSDIQWLIGPDAADILTATARQADPLRAAAALRALGPTRAALVGEQVKLRQRAIRKFKQPERMFFTARGLEQSTDEWIARYKAARFEVSHVTDLCTGIGGDAIALAAYCGRVTLVESDPHVAVLAEANVRALAPDAALTVCTQPMEQLQAGDHPCWHADPDRRPRGSRVSQLDGTSPNASVLEAWWKSAEQASLKLAPATQVPQHWSDAAELEWISRDRECKQQVAWFGKLARQPGRRTATKVMAGPEHQAEEFAMFAGEPGVPLETATTIGRFIFEPDPAVLAADLTGALAVKHQLMAVDSRVAYLTGDDCKSDALLAAFEVTDVLPLDRKQLRRLLAARGIGQLEIKQRGTDIEPARLRRELKLKGDGQATLLVARINARVTAVLAQRLEQP